MGWNQDRFKATLDFAAKAHGPQQVPGSGAPYVVHLVKVATEVLAAIEPGLDVDLAVTCALLHDTLEDTGTSEAALAQAFGPAVAAGVRALTKDEALPKAERMADSLRRLAQQPREVRLVKLADRITNLEPPPAQWTLEKRRGYLEEARQILAALRGTAPALEARFEQKLVEYQAFT